MTDFALTPIEQCGQRVLTTAQLAEAYGTTVDTINRNFNRNKDRYTEGKHFYCLTGEDLKNFASDNLSGANSNKVRTLYLWTERGALLHAKSLNTDKAWEVYDFLLDTYFRVREQAPVTPLYADTLLMLNQKQNELESLVTSFKGEYESRIEKLERRVNGDDLTAQDLIAFRALVSMFSSPTCKLTIGVGPKQQQEKD